MISSPMPMAMLVLLTAQGTDGFTITIADELPLYQLLLIIGTTTCHLYIPYNFITQELQFCYDGLILPVHA